MSCPWEEKVAQDVSALIHLYCWTWSSQLCTTGEPPCLSEERCFKSSAVLFIYSSCSWVSAAAPPVFTHSKQLCEGCCREQWLSPSFRLSGSSPAGQLWRWSFCLLQLWAKTESFAPDCSDAWSGSLPPPGWPEHHPAALMLLCRHSPLSKHHQLVLLKLLSQVPSDHGMLLHTGGGDLITVWDTKHSYYSI